MRQGGSFDFLSRKFKTPTLPRRTREGWGTPRLIYPWIDLLQRLYIIRDGLGVISRESGNGFLVRGLLGFGAFGEQIGDLIGAEGRAFHGGADLALALGPVAGSALGFVGGCAIGSECR